MSALLSGLWRNSTESDPISISPDGNMMKRHGECQANIEIKVGMP